MYSFFFGPGHVCHWRYKVCCTPLPHLKRTHCFFSIQRDNPSSLHHRNMMAATTCTPSPIDALSKSNVTKGLASVNSLNHTTSDSDGYFAFARINDEVYLVQGTFLSSSKAFFLKKLIYIIPFSLSQFHVQLQHHQH